MKKLKIAIIGQWCYPANTPRAFRAWELAKEFAREGHDVTLYALLGEYDYSNLEKTLNFKIKNLGYSKLGNTNSSDINAPLPILARMILRIVKDPNIYPGIEFFPMIRRALKQEKGIDLLITIAHPHVIHWATSASIDRTLVKYWVADCGDPYMGNPFSKHPFFMKWVEKKWCQKADFITIPIKEGINAYYPEFREKIRIIPQGFNFSETPIAEYRPNKIPTFAFAGNIYIGKRDPIQFLEFLISQPCDFKFIIYTRNTTVKQYAEKMPDKIEIRPYIPRKDLIFELSKMDFLINIKNISSVQSPSKLIDYAISKRPVLEISTQLTELEKTNFSKFAERNYSEKASLPNLGHYDICNICKQIISLITK